MPNVLVRDIEQQTLERLKARAAAYHHSLQQELKIILKQAAFQYTLQQAAKVTEAFRKKVGKKKQSDSAVLMREDRRR